VGVPVREHARSLRNPTVNRHRLPFVLWLSTKLPVQDPMQNKERWQVLCVQAANEQDSQKLSELIEEIASLLQERDARLRAKRSEG